MTHTEAIQALMEDESLFMVHAEFQLKFLNEKQPDFIQNIPQEQLRLLVFNLFQMSIGSITTCADVLPSPQQTNGTIH